MSSGPNQTMIVGQTIKLHVQPTQIDGATADNVVPLTVSTLNPTIASVAVDGSDPHAVNVTGLAAGVAIVFVDENPACPSGRALQMIFAVGAAAPPNLRQVLFVSADPPAP